VSGEETWETTVEIPENATPQQREALIQAAIDKKIDGDIDDMFKGF